MNLKRHNLLWVLGLVGAPFLLFSFQNCGGEFALQEDVAYQQSLSDLQNNLDRQYIPSLLESSDLGYWNPDGSGDSIQKNPFLASSMSLVIAVDRVASGSVITIGSGGSNEEGNIFITNGKIRAIRRTSAVSYSYLEVALPSEGAKMVIAASFGEAAGDISLLVNGIIQSGTPVVAGVPLDFSYLQKSVTSAPVGGKIYESMAYGVKLGHAELNVLSRYLASNNQISNVFLDPSLASANPADGTGGASGQTLQFLAAKSVIDSKCLSCHGAGSGNGDFSNLTQKNALSMGLVVAGKPEASSLYYRLQGSSGSNGTKNMPLGDSILVTEVQVVADWISGIE